ncbi:MAG TPA: amidohydrolase family protein [Gemmatimonadaceae bacterium]|nr:amidohydrolase family protein [Gemmatimonadaceae bacterium]
MSSRIPTLAAAALCLLACPGPALRAQASDTTRAFTGFTLIDGTGRAPIPNATLIVRNGRIVAAGPSSRVSIPANAERVPLDGKFVMPGLINGHGHAGSVKDLATYAAYGVTTVFSLGDEPAEVFAAREAQRGQSPRFARVYLSGPVLTPASPDEARAQVAAVAARNVDIVKIRVDNNLGSARKMAPEVYRAVIDAAHARKLRVAVHLYYLEDAKALLAAGADYIAHSVRDQPVDSAFVRALVASKVCYSPTLMREVSTFVYDTTPPFFSDSLFLAHANRQWMATVQEPARQQATRSSTAAQRYKAQLPVAMRNLVALHRAGVPIEMGTDTGPLGRFQGYFELMELEMMVDAGLTSAQALHAATAGAAKCMRVDRELGTLERGKWADMLVLDASPLEGIANIRRQHSVWIGGANVSAP